MTEQDKTPIQRAGRHRPAVALFVLITVFTLGADLLSKHFAFKYVAGEELKLSRDPDDGTTVVSVRDVESGEWVASPRLREGSPSSAHALFDQSEFGQVVIPNVLSLKLTINTGAVFGIGKGAQWFFIVVGLVAVIFISIVFARSSRNDRWLHLCLALILAGAIGNLYDRMLFNGVRDMCFLFPGVDLPFGLNWPGGATSLYPWIFNIADAALVVGVLVLLVSVWRRDVKTAKVRKAEKAEKEQAA